MKNFDDFREYVHQNSSTIHSSIHQKVIEAESKHNFKDVGEEHEFNRRAWVEIGVLEMLEHYHNWLNS